MADEPPTVVARVEREADAAHLLHIRLDDLAGDGGDAPLAEVTVELTGRHAATIREPWSTPGDPAVAGRLLAAATDELRALGRRRLIATVATDDGRTGALTEAGFREVRREGALVHLGLEL